MMKMIMGKLMKQEILEALKNNKKFKNKVNNFTLQFMFYIIQAFTDF